MELAAPKNAPGFEGVVIVICPLMSLQKNQVRCFEYGAIMSSLFATSR